MVVRVEKVVVGDWQRLREVAEKVEKLHLKLGFDCLNMRSKDDSFMCVINDKTLGSVKISVLEKTDTGEDGIDHCRSEIENIVDKIKVKDLTLNVPQKPLSQAKIVLRNHHVERLTIQAPCNFEAVVRMPNLRRLSVQPGQSGCCLAGVDRGHRVGVCVARVDFLYRHCPDVEYYCGVFIGDVNMLRMSFHDWSAEVGRRLLEVTFPH
eukprot:GFUD01005499.1.p1 GENE.GFUD01005499.1~~GFUD01005499.1.p1  ORF type:complete len:244 (+),score=62.85 GFUD01005499.1:109-732(+)